MLVLSTIDNDRLLLFVINVALSDLYYMALHKLIPANQMIASPRKPRNLHFNRYRI